MSKVYLIQYMDYGKILWLNKVNWNILVTLGI